MYKDVSNLALLKMLCDERQKFTRSDKDLMHGMIDELVTRGVYPNIALLYPNNHNNVYTMVECWGAYWHEWNGKLNCPHCNLDLRDHNYGPPFKREIGVYDQARDRTSHYKCPSCQKDFPR